VLEELAPRTAIAWPGCFDQFVLYDNWGMNPKFVALDRDGTIIHHVEHLQRPEEVKLLKGAGEAISCLNAMRIPTYIVTNQSVIGRGFITRLELDEIHFKLTELLASQNAHVDGIFYCPHVREDNCHCRKPRTGLLIQAAELASADPSRGLVIGDNPSDMLMAVAAGARAIHVQTGVIAKWPNDFGIPSVAGLADAVDLVTDGSCGDHRI
jgi:histidinol-phosphate phosphatase family protein